MPIAATSRPTANGATPACTAGCESQPSISPDQALGLPLGEALQARTILAVHRHALAARDEAADRIRRHGLAAARELREQPVQANDKHPGLRGLAFSSLDNFFF